MMTAEEAAAAFDGHRGYLTAVAYRMLGSLADAEDAVQETYLRFARADLDTIREPRGWLTTVIGRICLDHLGSARARHEEYIGPWLPEPLVDSDAGLGMAPLTPEDRVTLDESVSMAMLVVLESLSPPERTAFVLHDVLSLSYEEVVRHGGPLGSGVPAAHQSRTWPCSGAGSALHRRRPAAECRGRSISERVRRRRYRHPGQRARARSGSALGRRWPGQRGRPTAGRRRRERRAVAARRGREAPCVPLDATGQRRYRPGFRTF